MADWYLDTDAINALTGHPAVQADVDRRAEVAREAADRVCPRRTGALAASIRVERDGPGRRVVYGGGPVWYAPLIEWGTRPHEIRPVRASVLRWEDETGVHFARRVWHPGTRAYRVMSGTAYQAALNA